VAAVPVRPYAPFGLVRVADLAGWTFAVLQVGRGVQFLRVEDGKITEARIYFDQLDQMNQLGLIPVPATG
jgi:hypothetical protein